MVNERLIKKYAVKSPSEMRKEQAELREEVALKSKELEQEIEDFSSKTDKLINPETNRPMAVVKRPSKAQFEVFTPPQLLKYREHPEKIPPEVAIKYESGMYKLMEELIVAPKHTAKWWRENTGDDFMALFQAHLMKLRENMEKTIESFL